MLTTREKILDDRLWRARWLAGFISGLGIGIGLMGVAVAWGFVK